MAELTGGPRPNVDEIVNAIGPRLREQRLQRGLSLQQLAERAGVSAAAIHKIERNGMVPTITTLLKLAEAFDRPVGWFVDEDGEANGPVALTRAGDRPRAHSPWPGVDLHSVSGSHSRFVIDGTMATAQPGSGTGPSAPEKGAEQLFVMLEGTLDVEADGEAHHLGPGDAIHLRADLPHRWQNTADSVARFLRVSLGTA